MRGIQRRYSVRRTGSRRFYDLLTATYPALNGEPAFARLFVALLSPNKVGESESGEPEVILDGPTLAACMGEATEYAYGNLRGDDATGPFLYAFRHDVLPNLRVTEYVEGTRARAVPLAHVREVVDDRVWDAWRRDADIPAHELEERVYLDTGAPYTAPSVARERARRAEVMEGYEEHAPVAPARRLYRLLNDTHPLTFDSVRKRFGAAWEAARGLDTEKARADARRALQYVADEPKQFYRFSPYSPRLWGDNPGVATVATPVRRALLADCYELDLASSQLSIAAKEWGCERLYAHLRAGRSVWPELTEAVGLPYNEAAKRAVKEGAYGLVFGAGEGRIVHDITETYEREGGGVVPDPGAFLNHPLMSEVYDAREARLAQIEADGYVVDCFGRTLTKGQVPYGRTKRAATGGKARRSLLAQQMQARELWLLEPVIALTEAECARGRPEWRILCWQHDGFSVRFRRRNRSDLYLGRIIEAVRERAEGFGYTTRLAVKEPPSDMD